MDRHGTQQWVSIDDAKPPVGAKVIVYTVDGTLAFGYRTWQQGSNPERWIIDRANYPETQAGVTYWMPLPALPSKEEQTKTNEVTR